MRGILGAATPAPSTTAERVCSPGTLASRIEDAVFQVYGGAGDLSMSGVWNFSSGEMQRNTRDVARGERRAEGGGPTADGIA